MFFEITGRLYSAFLAEKPSAIVPSEYVGIAEKVAKKVGWNMAVTGIECKGSVPAVAENNKVMVALSGGLDSVYLMYKLIDEGYAVTALHVAGLNKASSMLEEAAARACAKKAGVPFMVARFKAPRQAFPDNPFKNQLVLSIMLDKGIKQGIYRYAVGSDWTTPLKEAVPGYTITDAADVYREFWQGVQDRFPQAELIFISDTEKKYDRLKTLFERDALNDVSSCISPLRFRRHLHEENVAKYHISLMKDRCGSCYKCSMEYILLVEAGLIQRDDAYYEHCWHILATSKRAHRPDLFAKHIPIEKRLQNLKDYGS